VSAWLAEAATEKARAAAEHAAGRAAARELVTEYESEHGPLPAASRQRAREFLPLHDEVTAARVRPIVPVVVLAQAWRGAPPHQISRVLKGCDILPDDAATGRAAGVACAASGTGDVVDAIVIATAVRHQAAVATSDPRDLTRLADAIGVKIQLFPT
jgi:predicted nucleic acid-binding protein